MYKIEITQYGSGYVRDVIDCRDKTEKQIQNILKKCDKEYNPDLYYPQIVKIVRLK